MRTKELLRRELKDSSRPIIYMARPDHFGVEYDINPWMSGQLGRVNKEVAIIQWKSLVKILRLVADVRVVCCDDPFLPDSVFIANAGSILPINDEYCFIPSNFKHPERKDEKKFFIDTMKWEDLRINEDITCDFEGDGDLLRMRDRLVIGHGFRTSDEFITNIDKKLEEDTIIPLKLVDPRFYHLDTCFFYHNVDSHDIVMYYPEAFSEDSLYLLRKAIIDLNINALEINEAEALLMSCNAIGCNKSIIGHAFSYRITGWLNSKGFNCMITSLSEFHKAGGSAKCLTFRIPRSSMMELPWN